MTTCTAVTCQNVAKGRVLAQSYAAQHDGERIYALVLDDTARTIRSADEPFEVLTPGDLDLDRHAFLGLAARYESAELAAAVKPWLISALLDRGAGEVLYLDPDMLVLGSLRGLTDAAQTSTDGIALVPHRLTPVPQDGLRPSEAELVRSGVFDLGLVAATRAAAPFLAWWKARHDVDEAWVDQVPAVWRPAIVRDPAYNVGFWNADERDDAAAKVVHFAGFDPDIPHMLSTRVAHLPRVLLSEHPTLAALVGDYATALEAAGHREAQKSEYGFSRASNGFVLDRRSRDCYRDGDEEPPNPFLDGDAFMAWLRAPAIGGPQRVSRYLESVWRDRPDLKSVYPRLDEPDGLLLWARLYGHSDAGMAIELIPDDEAAAPPPESLAAIRAERGLPSPRPFGVNVVGHFAAESGVGESARLLVSALRAGRIPHELVGYVETVARQGDPFGGHESNEATQDVNIVCINADELTPFVHGPGRTLFDGRPTVGLWMWEVDEFPPSMAAAARYVDEVWMGSAHSAEAVRAAVDVPVFTFPLPVVPLDAPTLSRADLKLPADAFVFLFAFSFHSVVERKNPFALIDAFTRAFAPNEGPRLVIKSIHGDRNLPQLERLRAAAAHRDDIEIRDGVVSRAEHASLVHACDAYVSLHRAEGFGLTTAEAMAIGKPVIATGYSGNLENMTAENSWLVPYELVEVGPDARPYPAAARWAEPDVDAAAAAMREVVDHPAEAAKRGERAARDIAIHHGPAARVKFINERLRALTGLRVVTPPPPSPPPPSPIARRVVRRLAGYVRLSTGAAR